MSDAVNNMLPHERPYQRDNLNKLIKNKREMFQVQRMLDIKRKEIAKLERMGLKREEGLVQSEKLLDEDLERFKK